MKKLLIITGLMAAFSATSVFAESGREVVRPIARLTGVNLKITEVVLYQSGLLQVTDKDGNATTKRLTEETQQKLEYYASSLANVELKTVHNQVVCMMMPLFPPENLFVAQTDSATGFVESLRLLLSAQGCYLSDRTYPAEQYSYALAEQLKASLEVLATEAESSDAS